MVQLTGADFPAEWRDIIPGDAFTGRSDIDGLVTVPTRFQRIADRRLPQNALDLAPLEQLAQLGTGAFSGCTRITEIRFTNGFQRIGRNAFRGCTALAKVTLPSSLRAIGSSAFKDCVGLIRVDLPAALSRIQNGAFRDCVSLSQIDFPDALNSIDGDAFDGCCSLLDIDLPDSVSRLGMHVFRGCTSLRHLRLNPQLAERGWYVETNEAGIKLLRKRLVEADFCIHWGDTIPMGAFSGRSDIVGSVVVPSRFRKIDFGHTFQDFAEVGSFSGCNRITEIRLPDGFEVIPSYTFKDCTRLVRISLPATLTRIGKHCFDGCSSLAMLDLPDSLIEIGTSAFRGCSAIKELWLPEYIELLGAHAFAKCLNLRVLSMRSVRQFESARESRLAFGTAGFRQYAGCSNLRAVSAPAEVAARLPTDVFKDCGTPAPALLSAATPGLQLWYCWSLPRHRRCSPVAKQTVRAMMLVCARLRRNSKSRLPALPTEIWFLILGLLFRRDLGRK